MGLEPTTRGSKCDRPGQLRHLQAARVTLPAPSAVFSPPSKRQFVSRMVSRTAVRLTGTAGIATATVRPRLCCELITWATAATVAPPSRFAAVALAAVAALSEV